MARNLSYDINKDYYQILGINVNATTKDVLDAFNMKMNQLNEDIEQGEITQEEAVELEALLFEATDVLSNNEVREEYERARRSVSVYRRQADPENQPIRVVDEEEAEETAKKGKGYLIPLAATAIVLLVMLGTVLGNSISSKLGLGNKKDILPDDKPSIETTIDQTTDEEQTTTNNKTTTDNEETFEGVKNFGDPTNDKQVLERVEKIQAQLNDLNVINLQTGLPYTDSELKAIIQYVNGAFLPSKEADAYTMVDETLNFYAAIISSPRTLNMVQYQANSDVVTEDIVKKDIECAAPFDYSLLLMGNSYCYDVIEYFNNLYAKLLTTTDKDEFKSIHNKIYKSLAELMYGDGLVIKNKSYKIRDFEGLQNQNDASVLNALMYNIPVFHVEGIKEKFKVYYSQAGDVIVPLKEIDEQFNALCSSSDYNINDEGLVYITGESNFATVNQTQMINSALQNYQLGNTDAYANGYQYTIKK